MHSFTSKSSLSFLFFMLIAIPKQTSTLEVSRTLNLCFRLISNYSFSELRLVVIPPPGISSAASKPSVQKGAYLLFTLLFSEFKTNLMKIRVAYFRGKLSKVFPSQNCNSSAICTLTQDCRWKPKGSTHPSTKLPSKPQCYLLFTHFAGLIKYNSAISQPDYSLYYKGINC